VISQVNGEAGAFADVALQFDAAPWALRISRTRHFPASIMPSDWFLEEYKLIQSKIDQVLTSQFQVRSRR
jgi:hypothetical protein